MFSLQRVIRRNIPTTGLIGEENVSLQRYVSAISPFAVCLTRVMARLTNVRVLSSVPLQIRERIASIEEKGDRKVTRFSITGYSLGGLLARYVIGALHAAKFFDTVEPVNFTTIATPHLGIPKYPSFFSAMVGSFSPMFPSDDVRTAYTTLLSP
jgi:hypothetical protein